MYAYISMCVLIYMCMCVRTYFVYFCMYVNTATYKPIYWVVPDFMEHILHCFQFKSVLIISTG